MPNKIKVELAFWEFILATLFVIAVVLIHKDLRGITDHLEKCPCECTQSVPDQE